MSLDKLLGVLLLLPACGFFAAMIIWSRDKARMARRRAWFEQASLNQRAMLWGVGAAASFLSMFPTLFGLNLLGFHGFIVTTGKSWHVDWVWATLVWFSGTIGGFIGSSVTNRKAPELDDWLLWDLSGKETNAQDVSEATTK